MDRLERAVLKVQQKAISDHDFRVEQSIYFETMLAYIKQYKKNKDIDETSTFLKSLGN